MSLTPSYKNFDSLSPIYFLDPNGKIDFISEDRYTLQGLNLLTYNINKSANDSFVKNYTVNNLIKDKNSNDIFSLREVKGVQDLNTKLNFKTTQNTLSATFFLQALTTRNDDDSIITFNIDITDVNGEKFLVDFLGNDICTVSFIDGKIKKFLYDDGGDALVFKFIDNIVAPASSYQFNYYFDNNNNRLRLFKDNKVVTNVMTILVTDTQVISTIDGEEQIITVPLSSTINSIGLSSINEQTLLNGTIGTDNKIETLQRDNIDQFTYYDFQNNYDISGDTVSGIKYDFLTYYTYNNIGESNPYDNIYGLAFPNLLLPPGGGGGGGGGGGSGGDGDDGSGGDGDDGSGGDGDDGSGGDGDDDGSGGDDCGSGKYFSAYSLGSDLGEVRYLMNSGLSGPVNPSLSGEKFIDITNYRRSKFQNYEGASGLTFYRGDIITQVTLNPAFEQPLLLFTESNGVLQIEDAASVYPGGNLRFMNFLPHQLFIWFGETGATGATIEPFGIVDYQAQDEDFGNLRVRLATSSDELKDMRIFPNKLQHNIYFIFQPDLDKPYTKIKLLTEKPKPDCG